MTVVYLDLVFLLNGVVDYLLLLSAGRLAGECLHRGRLALGAVLGGLYAGAVFLPGMGFLVLPPCKIGAAVLMLLCAYGGSRHLLRVSLVFFAVSAAFGGGVFALSLLGGRGIAVQNGVFYSALDLRLILLSAAVCYGVLRLAFGRGAGHSPGELRSAVVTLGERKVSLTALVLIVLIYVAMMVSIAVNFTVFLTLIAAAAVFFAVFLGSTAYYNHKL